MSSADYLAGLNPAQRAAVEHETGPLIVLAGPGTGKTRVISCRIAHMIHARSIDPDKIVAVTFTVKAAEQMRHRVATLIDPTSAERVHIHTFHGLGNRLLRRFSDFAGLPDDLTVIDSSQRRSLLRSLVIEQRLFQDDASRGIDLILQRVANQLEFLSNSGTSGHAAQDLVRLWDRRLDDNADRLDEAQLDAERAQLSFFRDVVSLQGAYGRACAERGLLEFDHLITRPTNLLRDDPRVRAICRDELRHFVVDEYQDVNEAQIRFLHELAPTRSPDNASPELTPDLCVVGDDDQAIYGFRGADVQAFERFRQTWTRSTTIRLTTNYRSRPEIIEAANTVIAGASNRFDPDKVIEPGGSHRTPGSVECVSVAEGRDTPELIALLLREARLTDPMQDWSRYAVVVRNNAHLDDMASALELEQIPYRLVRPGSVSDPGVDDVMAWAHLLGDPDATWAATRALRRPPIGAPLEQVAAWTRAYRTELARARGGDRVASTFASWLDRSVRDPHAERFCALYSKLRARVDELPADELLFTIVKRLRVSESDGLDMVGRHQRVSALVSLIRFARERQERLEEPGDLHAFLTYWADLDAKEQASVGLGDDQIDPADGVVGDDETPDAVQILTAHGAKGLEFDTVFLPHVAPTGGYGKTKSDDRLELPAWLQLEGAISRDDLKTEARDEERRVFYVACTRAERRLVLFSTRLKKTSSSPSHYFHELTRKRATHPEIDATTVLERLRDAGISPASDSVEERLRRASNDMSAAARRESPLDQLRTSARDEAVRALTAADRPGLDPETLASLAERLTRAVERLGLAAEADATGTLPIWVTGADPDAVDAVRVALAAEQPPDSSTPDLSMTPMRPPLSLSYSMIDKYEQCPRCFYTRYGLDLSERPTHYAAIGNIVHSALETFYEQWRLADAEGRTPPGLDELLTLGRRAFGTKWPLVTPAVEAYAEQVRAQLEHGYTALHDEQAHVLKLEQSVRFPYEVDGTTHRFTAKLDRVDQMHDGPSRFRIVDYKTGKSRPALAEPDASDLQLGIYAMALHYQSEADLRGDDPEAPPIRLPETAEELAVGGVAEYWILSEGTVGRIELQDLNIEAIRDRIDRAVRGMLAGTFPRNDKHKFAHDCELLGPEAV